MREVRVTANVTLPALPNFLRIDGLAEPMDVAHVSDDDLRRIGSAWTEALIEHARARRGGTPTTTGGDA